MNRILITGGAGFIGSNLARSFVERGETVRILDNFSTGRRENLAELGDGVEIIEGDLRDVEIVRKAAAGMKYVFHEGALPSVSRSVEAPATTNETNVTGTLNILTACKENHVERLIFASSSSVYGNRGGGAKAEEMAPAPESPYAVSKLAAEHYCRVFQHVYGLDTIILRYFNVFGPNQDPRSDYAAVIPRFITYLLDGRQPTIYGDGLQTRDFTYVENIVEANFLAMESKGTAGEVINVACGRSHSVQDLLQRLQRLIGTAIEPLYEDAKAGDVRHSMADLSKAKRILGYLPRIGLDEGLEKAIAYFRQHRSRPQRSSSATGGTGRGALEVRSRSSSVEVERS